MLMKSSNNTANNQSEPWTRIVGWLLLASELTKHFPKTLHKDISQRVKQYAECQQIETRINDLTPSANARHSSQTKITVKFIVVGISSLTFGAGAQALTEPLGPYSLPAALGIGATATFLADAQATQVMTRVRRKQSTENALKAIERQAKTYCPVNEFGLLFNQTQTALVQHIEGKNLEPQPLHELLPLGVLSGSQYALAFSVVSSLGLPGGIAVNAIAACLPVAVQWTAALIQSACLEMPEHDADLIEKYRSYLPVEPLTEEEEKQLISIDDAIARAERDMEYKMDLDRCRIEFIEEGDPSGRLKNWQMAEADFGITWSGNKKQLLEQERDRQIDQCRFQCKADIAKLSDRYEKPAGCLSPQQVQADKEKWLDKKTRELEQERDRDIQWIKDKYASKIKQCEDKVIGYQKSYDLAYQQWLLENAHPNNQLFPVVQVSQLGRS